MVKTPGASTARRGCLARDPALCLELSLLLSASLPRGLLTSPLAFRKHTKHASVAGPSYPLLLCQENSSRYLPDSLPQCLQSSLRCRPLVGLPGQPVSRRSPAQPSLSVCSLLLWCFPRRLNRLPMCCGFHSLMFVVCVSPVFGRLGSELTPVLAHGRCSVNVAECTTKNTAAS